TIWYRRMSIVYALGAWSVLGSAIFLTRKPKMSDYGENEEDDSSNEMPFSTSEDSDLAMERAEPIKGFYTKTIVKYSENSVPLTQRILNYLNSWTGGPGPQS
ncbi:hypothetical protein, partial [Salmonella sp. s58313]|uniref:hypothetical protein n=1 Tax=Salmonella sp. s58313 TaxID=3160131 RepID=UPI0037553CA4